MTHPRHNFMHLHAGFTLVELAIALMVIGLLISGVLKGQELIENARITRVVKDLKDYDTATMIFRNTYNALPGDMKNPATRLPNCGPPYCDITSTANGNGMIENSNESRNFWIHLHRAGLITNITERDDHFLISPQNAFGGHMSMIMRSALYNAAPTEEHPYYNVYYVTDSPQDHTLKNCSVIQRIDDKLDDGKPRSGIVYVFIDHQGSADCYDPDTLEYTRANRRTYILVRFDAAN